MKIGLRVGTTALVLFGTGCLGALSGGSSRSPDPGMANARVAEFEAAMGVDAPANLETEADVKARADARKKLWECGGDVPTGEMHAWKTFARDYSEAKLTTSKGELSAAEMRSQCEKRFNEFESATITACGTRQVSVESLATPAGWTDPTISPPKRGWYFTPCAEAPAAKGPKEVEAIRPQIMSACGEGTGALVMPSQWGTSSEANKRVVLVECRRERGAFSDWRGGDPSLKK
ncbi:hypothetical protein [Polyangium sp. y55x31]|uniref:hypothetical protein n=1 Tax=Polyangium sp. y55x31 TaxID=3042688 RepID=UPI002482B7D3|nr:hypothetical protein [Polyangium sp. y55x31]MDI1479304.1 hypothetical protein [Polyangium sp. y55x31]